MILPASAFPMMPQVVSGVTLLNYATNPSFDTSTDWTLGGGVSFGANKLTVSGAARIANQSMAITTGIEHLFYAKGNMTSGGLALRISSASNLTSEGTILKSGGNIPIGYEMNWLISATPTTTIVSFNAEAALFSGEFTEVAVYEKSNFLAANTSEFAINGNFSVASGWTLSGGVTYGTNKVDCISAGRMLNQDMGLITGKVYFVNIKGNCSSGSRLAISTPSSLTTSGVPVYPTQTISGTFDIWVAIKATNSILCLEANAAFYTGTITSISVKETNF